MANKRNVCRRQRRCRPVVLDALEQRLLLSAAIGPLAAAPRQILSLSISVTSTSTFGSLIPRGPGPISGVGAVNAHTNFVIESNQPAASPSASSLTPTQIRTAYGINQITFGSVTGDGTGQTIAIIDAYHAPTAYSDLQAFDAQFGIPDLALYTGSNTTPYFRQVAQDGSTSFPGTDSTGGWELEEALDIEWAHAIAPGANIILVEANSTSDADLIQNAVNWARSQPGVCAVSMSFSGNETSTERNYDTYFTTPSGHTGVTFFAATGDTGQPSGYPAYSPKVVAVGGTTLTLNGNAYSSESGWSGSGGGVSLYESQPTYQNGVVTQSSTKRTNPDVAMDANPSSGVAVYDSFLQSTPWQQIGGTSLATPMWAALMAIIDQGRVLNGLSALDGSTQVLPMLYSLSGADFHDITTGNNGFAAAAGYDLVTGRGTPVANLLVADMSNVPSAATGTPSLAHATDSGVSNSDNITNFDNSSPAKALQFIVPNTIAGSTINIFADGQLIGSAVASTTSTTVTTNGSFTLSNASHSITTTQIQPGLGQSAPSTTLTIQVDTTAPVVTAQSPTGPVAGTQSDLRLTFSQAIDTSSFSPASDIPAFTGPNGNLLNQITGFTWSSGNTVLDVTFNPQNTIGDYQMVIGPQILDIAGNPMSAAYSANFTIPSPGTGAPALLAASDSGYSNSDAITNLDNSSAAMALQFNVPSTIPGATITLYSDSTDVIGTATATGTSTTVTTNGTLALSNGNHAITAKQTVPGSPQSLASPASFIDVDTSLPTVTGTSPTGTVTAAQSSVQFTFSEPMDPTSFSLPTGIQSFSSPLGNIPSAVTGFSWSANDTVLTVQFIAQSTGGSYQLVLAPLLRDAGGNLIAYPASASFSIVSTLYSANMNTNPGWRFSAPYVVGATSYQWQYGAPANKGHGPATAHTGTNVVGFNLTGNGTFPAGMSSTQYATFTLNASGETNLVLNFWYWLEVGTSAQATIQVSPDGVNWTTLFNSGTPPAGTLIVSTAWANAQYAIPSFANQSALQIRWGLGPILSNANPRSGWTLDDVTVTGVPAANSSITGTVFQDNNSNGTQDSGEPGIPGATVYLDLNQDGSLDPGDPTAITNSSGIYSFTGLVSGSYTVREILPANQIATGALAAQVSANGPVTNQNFANFPTTLTASDNASLYLTLDSTGTKLQISNGTAASATPAYQIALSAIPSLTLNLTGNNDSLYLDFSNGSPIPAGNITLNAATVPSDQLFVLGQNLAQSFSMTDTQIGPTAGGGSINFVNLAALHFSNLTVNFSGTLSTVQQLFLDSQTNFIWS